MARAQWGEAEHNENQFSVEIHAALPQQAQCRQLSNIMDTFKEQHKCRTELFHFQILWIYRGNTNAGQCSSEDMEKKYPSLLNQVKLCSQAECTMQFHCLSNYCNNGLSGKLAIAITAGSGNLNSINHTSNHSDSAYYCPISSCTLTQFPGPVDSIKKSNLP